MSHSISRGLSTVARLSFLSVCLLVLAFIMYLLFSPLNGSGNAVPGTGQTVKVRLARTEIGEIAESLESLGTTRANEAVQVTANASGKVVEVKFEDGDWVESGAVLLRLDDARERAQLQEAEVNLKENRRLLRHYTELAEKNAVSRTLLDEQQAKVSASEAQVAAARAVLEDFTIRAPFSGLLGLRQISPGALVTPGTVVTTLDDIQILKIEFTVPERWLGRLAEGQTIVSRSVAYPKRVFEGEVISLGSRVDPVTRAVTVLAAVDNTRRLLRPGMLLTLSLVWETEKALMVPEQVVLPEGDRQYVFVVNPDNVVSRREVALGRRRPGRVEIIAGLDPGENIVVDGIQKVGDGTVVEPISSEP